jgi:hypothetical protein
MSEETKIIKTEFVLDATAFQEKIELCTAKVEALVKALKELEDLGIVLTVKVSDHAM